MYPQGVCRIRKPAYAGNGCAIFPIFHPAAWGKRPAVQPQTIYSEIPSYKSASGKGCMMNSFIFENKTKVYFGRDCVKEHLGEVLKGYGETVMLQIRRKRK